MIDSLATWIWIAGLAQLGVLGASILVPLRLRWSVTLGVLPRLHRQLYWVYGGYIVLSIVSFALLSLFCSREMASGSRLARGICAYITVFWGARLALQAVFDVGEHLVTAWLRVGYHALTVAFVCLTVIYGAAAFL